MADKARTPPPASAVAAGSLPLAPVAKRIRTTSPARAEDCESLAIEAAIIEPSENNVESAAPPELAQDDTTEDDEELEADDSDEDSAFGTDNSDTTSIASSIYAGYVENGRRYQTKREGEYWGPSDEKQFQSMQAAHIVYMILDSKQKNPYFQAPLSDTIQNILDIGTGNGAWAREVADRYPGALVQGIDLYPPPDIWVPPNCRFEVDDVLKKWEFKENGHFNLIHMRDMMGSFTDEQWRLVYKQAYNNLAPGGWIEQIEAGITYASDDGSLKEDSTVNKWGDHFNRLCAKTGRNIDTMDTFKARIEKAGFINVHEKVYKVPVGEWAKGAAMKELGRFCKAQIMEGIEGYAMFLLTKFGEPTPWTPDEVQVYLAKMRNELNDPKLHAYCMKRRVWAQKPLDA